ncbi:MAG: hypothetical protein IPN58_11955 [Anaerolineales bacterium]|nr:hypothetical protein [Anaerolineales bacterium]
MQDSLLSKGLNCRYVIPDVLEYEINVPAGKAMTTLVAEERFVDGLFTVIVKTTFEPTFGFIIHSVCNI